MKVKLLAYFFPLNCFYSFKYTFSRFHICIVIPYAAEALKEHDIITKDLKHLIEQKKIQIRELENDEAALEIRLQAVADNTEENEKMRREIRELEIDIKSKKKDLVSLNKKLQTEKTLSNEKEVELQN